MLFTKNRGLFITFLLLRLHNESVLSTECKSGKNLAFPSSVTLPVSYEIKLVPQIFEDFFTLTGESRIFAKVLKGTPKVTIRSERLRVDEDHTSLVDANGIMRKATKRSSANSTTFLVIEFDLPIESGNCMLGLQHAGNITDGIYNSSYVNEEGDKKWFVAVKFFETTPLTNVQCWSDFDIEATFDLSINHPNITANKSTSCALPIQF